MQISFEDIIKSHTPSLTVAIITAKVSNPPTDDALWELITNEGHLLRQNLAMEEINKRPAILATRQAYKAFGKDPNRYRPSAEALTRRVVKGLELFRTTTLVDLINLISLSSGHSIGAFDADKIEGEKITLGVGRAGEPYAAIGRGELNIEGLPVWRDSVGGFGTPTSDNERTKLSESTDNLLITVNCYGCEPSAQKTAENIVNLLQNFANAKEINVTYHRP